MPHLSAQNYLLTCALLVSRCLVDPPQTYIFINLLLVVDGVKRRQKQRQIVVRHEIKSRLWNLEYCNCNTLAEISVFP